MKTKKVGKVEEQKLFVIQIRHDEVKGSVWEDWDWDENFEVILERSKRWAQPYCARRLVLKTTLIQEVEV